MDTYKVGDLKKLISESSNEFKAKLGNGVESKNKEINGKAYSDAKKRAKDYDGGLEHEMLEEKPEYEKLDANKTPLDYNPENVSKEYKERVKANVKGYSSKAEMENGLPKTGDFSDNEKVYNQIKKSGQEMHKNQKEFAKSGLQARNWPDSAFEKEEMYESKDAFNMRNMINDIVSRTSNISEERKKNTKVVYFKKTEFITEGQMLSKIPDEFKTEGEQFKMKDKTGNEYLIEWRNNKGNILEHKNLNGRNQSIARMIEMYDYKSSDSKSSRLNEGEDMLTSSFEHVRKLK